MPRTTKRSSICIAIVCLLLGQTVATVQAECAAGSPISECGMASHPRQIAFEGVGALAGSDNFRMATVVELLKGNELLVAREMLSKRIEGLENSKNHDRLVKDGQPTLLDCITLRAFVHFGLGDEELGMADFDRASKASGFSTIRDQVTKEKHSKEEWSKFALYAAQTMEQESKKGKAVVSKASKPTVAQSPSREGMMKFPPSQID